MAREGDETSIDTCVRGWAGRDTPLDALTGLVDELWAARRTDPGFFAAVVRGQHAVALAMIAGRRVSLVLDDDGSIRILTRMALIWAVLSGDQDETVAAIRMRLCGRDGSEIVAARQAMQGQLWC